MLFIYDEIPELGAKIKVIGVGGAGGNALNRMISNQMNGVEFIAMNTDAQSLNKNKAEIKIQIGREETQGKGAGANPEVGKKAAIESKESLVQAIDGSDVVFITAGMGGGTGTGASPIIAETAKSTGALVIAIVTRPFTFEGRKRSENAANGIEELRKHVDTLIVVQNQKLLQLVEQDTNLEDAFITADSILNQATKGISDLIIKDGLINLDLADVKTVMTNMGDAIMGIGTATGPSRGIMAASMAINSPLLDDVSITGAQGVLINFTGGKDMKLSEVSEAAEIIHQEAGDSANIIFGTVVDGSMKDEIQITVIATGFNKSSNIDDEIPIIKHVPKKPVTSIDREIVNGPETLETPAYIRALNKNSYGEQTGLEFIKESITSNNDTMPYSEIDYDVPAYLRKQPSFLK